MRRATVVGKNYNASCVKRHAKVNSDFYNTLCAYRNVDDLIDLDLSKNYVGNETGFDSILEVIKSAPQLKSVNLSCTGLTTQNVTDLVAILLVHPSVKELHLNENRLYIDSGMQLVRLCRFNPRILTVNVTDQPVHEIDRQLSNHIPPKIIAEMQRHIKFNRDQINKRSMAVAGGAGQQSASNQLRSVLAGEHPDDAADEM